MHGISRDLGMRSENQAGTGWSGGDLLMRFENLLNLAVKAGDVEGFFNKPVYSFQFKNGLHGTAGACQNDHRGFSHPDLLLGVIMAVGTDLAEIGQPVLSFGDANIKKHAIGPFRFGLPETLCALVGDHDLVTQQLELLLDDLTNVIFIINNENAFFAFGHFNLHPQLKICGDYTPIGMNWLGGFENKRRMETRSVVRVEREVKLGMPSLRDRLIS